MVIFNQVWNETADRGRQTAKTAADGKPPKKAGIRPSFGGRSSWHRAPLL